jgi:hypothetical protein
MARGYCQAGRREIRLDICPFQNRTFCDRLRRFFSRLTGCPAKLATPLTVGVERAEMAQAGPA